MLSAGDSGLVSPAAMQYKSFLGSFREPILGLWVGGQMEHENGVFRSVPFLVFIDTFDILPVPPSVSPKIKIQCF